MGNIKMLKRDADRWLEALRSGQYKQGAGRLQKDSDKGTSYCCLGVLELVVAGEVEFYEGAWEGEEWGSYFVPSEEFLQKHRIVFYDKENHPANIPYLSSIEDYASNANDRGLSFKELADAIEQEIEYLDT